MKKFLVSAVQLVVHTILRPAEKLLLDRYDGRTPKPVVFVVGPPRSGTTLVYDLLVTKYEFSYFSNFAHRFFRTPAAITLLTKLVGLNWSGSFGSDYGHIRGWSAPNEGGQIWNRWFDDSIGYCDSGNLLEVDADSIKRTVFAVSEAQSAPFINKNVMHSNRMLLLEAIFPGCLFIEVRRDVCDTVRSIVRAQRKNQGPRLDDNKWWSVRPSCAVSLDDTDSISRGCAQVLGVRYDIERNARALGDNRVLRVNYEDVCENTSQFLQNVQDFLKLNGVMLNVKHSVPRVFERMPSRKLDPNEEELLQVKLDEYERALDAEHV